MTIDADRAADLLEQMVAIPSPSGGEQKLALFLQDHLTELGFVAHIDDVGNLIADIGTGAGPTVMLLSHLDTVDRPIPVHRDTDGVLHGRGAVDAKAPLAAMISAAADRPGFAGRIRVVGAVEEERLARGGEHIAATVAQPDFLVVGEPGGWSTVVLGYKGKLDLTYRVSRGPTHSTNPVPKASEVAVAFWQNLLATLGPQLSHGAFHLPAATLRGIQADPEHALLDVDCRLPPGYDTAALIAALGPHLDDGELTLVREVPAVRTDRANQVARSLSAAIRRHGGTPRPVLKTGTSDMNTVARTWRMPMAGYGPGDSTLDHSEDERIDLAEFVRGAAVLGDALDGLVAG